MKTFWGDLLYLTNKGEMPLATCHFLLGNLMHFPWESRNNKEECYIALKFGLQKGQELIKNIVKCLTWK